MKLFFLPTVSAGFQAGELGEIHFGLGTTLAKWCETLGKMRNLTWSGYKVNYLFHLGAKTWARIPVNSSNIEAKREQIIYTLRVSLFSDFCDIQDLTFQNLQLLHLHKS